MAGGYTAAPGDSTDPIAKMMREQLGRIQRLEQQVASLTAIVRSQQDQITALSRST